MLTSARGRCAIRVPSENTENEGLVVYVSSGVFFPEDLSGPRGPKTACGDTTLQ